MKPRLLLRACSFIILFFALGLLLGQLSATTQEADSATLNVSGGLQTTSFGTSHGTVRVILPDDIRPGDLISGSISVEPTGTTEDEKTRNRDTLDGYVIDLGGSEVPVKRPRFTWIPAASHPATVSYRLQLFEILPGQTSQRRLISGVQLLPSGAVVTPAPKISSKISSGAVITPDPTPPKTVSRAVVMPNPKVLPTVGQVGRPILITGDFDGNAGNTVCKVGGAEILVIAESPRQAIFQAPWAPLGATELSVKEAGIETKGSFRNVAVILSAPKTSLSKGEKTIVTIKVNGLEGITSAVPLKLDATGVITMEGGNLQDFQIMPNNVTEGTYSTTREITGITAGGFNLTATVVVSKFDMCLQDDEAPATTIYINSFTGDYLMKAGGNGSELSGAGLITRKECVVTMEHVAADRKVVSVFDGCNKSGNAEVTRSDVAIAIIDRNISDNTCVMH